MIFDVESKYLLHSIIIDLYKENIILYYQPISQKKKKRIKIFFMSLLIYINEIFKKNLMQLKVTKEYNIPYPMYI